MDAELGIVAIGRNEGERLRACLVSSGIGQRHVIYVDSGSTDGSVELARGMGATAIELDASRPFTAARGRNAGLARLQELSPSVRFVQFVDGDCEILPGWLDAGKAALERDPTTAVVCGRLRERNRELSIYNELCDIEWDTPVGELGASGGNAMMRVSALNEVGAFDETLIAGEEPELCLRLRARHYHVRRIPDEMGLHDAAMFHFSQWWKRALRNGHAQAEMAYLHGREEGRPGVRTTFSSVAWGVGVPVAIGAGLTISRVFGAGAALYPWLFARMYRTQVELGRSHRQALTYATACTLGKFPESLGAGRFWLGLLSRKPSRIIEYKVPAS